MIGIVILNYNEWELTINCIRYIRENCSIPYRIYVVDNASPKRASKVQSDFFEASNDCKLIVNVSNKGYSAGNNVGIKNAIDDNCSHIIISNNDIIFKKDSIETLKNYLDNNMNYGIVGPKVFRPDGSIQEINMRCKMTMSGKYKYIIRNTPLGFIGKKFVNEFHVQEKDVNKTFDVYAVSGCCFMMSLDVAKQIYPLDENVFLYEEENIIGHKMEALNKKTAYVVESEVIHLGGASTDGLSSFSYACFVRSEQYYCKTYLRAKLYQRLPLYCIRVAIGVGKYGIGVLKELKK